MSISEIFQEFVQNLAIDNADQITLRYEEITACLNITFRDTDSKTANSLQVGSYGRWTAIKGVSDLDMLYIMPTSKWDDYKDNRQFALLNDTRNAIKDRYPQTEIFVDRLVVRVLYLDFHVEVQPVFEQEDGSFKYPDTYYEGSWKITKPRDEINAMKEANNQKNENLRRLCKMARAWKNKHGVGMGGLLIDTLAHNFLLSTKEYDEKSFSEYDLMSRDFYEYLSKEPDQEYYLALGSNQQIKVKKKFQKKAKKAYELCLDAIQSEGQNNSYDKWKKVYGRPFPSKPSETNEALVRKSTQTWNNTEEYIEDMFPIDIRNNLEIDCDISQNGFREHPLSYFLEKKLPLKTDKKLLFKVVKQDVKGNFKIYWKVLNRGIEAEKRNQIRGQIINDTGSMEQEEKTDFQGNHIVECYAVKNGVVVAKDRINVPIQRG